MNKAIVLLIYVLGLGLLAACSEKREPTAVSAHPSGWADSSSASFHGKLVLEGVLGSAGCQSCHGETLQGGNSAPGCSAQGCHSIYPHPQGWADSLSGDFHGAFIALSLSWDIKQCQACHGTDYKGQGYEVKNCTRCHIKPQGPEACNTCHGSDVNFAPPKDLEGHTAATYTGVGAHQHHLQDTTLTTAFTRDCNLCHIMPAAYSAPGHIDGQLPAEVIFGAVATDSSRLNSLWDHETASCSNIYCHGAFTFKKADAGANSWVYTDSLITGNNRLMKWNEPDSEQAECGTCHGLPPNGHLEQDTCNGCHKTVVDENFNIINKKLHINGKVDVF